MNHDSITLNGEVIKNNANIECDLQERLTSLQTGKCPFNGKYQYDSETSASIALGLISRIRFMHDDGDDDRTERMNVLIAVNGISQARMIHIKVRFPHISVKFIPLPRECSMDTGRIGNMMPCMQSRTPLNWLTHRSK